MTHSDLTLRIRDIIRTITGREFLGNIIIKNLEPKGYSVGIEAHQYYPVWYSAELSDEDFIKFITKELKQSKILRTQYNKAVRNTTLDHPLNRLVSPYDTARIN